MAYTYAEIPVTVPVNTESIGLGAQRMRALGTSILERLEATFVDVDAEPMIYKGGALVGDHVVDGDLGVAGTITALGFTGPFLSPIAASLITAGAFAAGTFSFPGNLSAGHLKAGRTSVDVGTGALGLSFAAVNHHRVKLTGPVTVTLSGGVVGTPYSVELLQDATGGRTVAWANVDWGTLAAPTQTSTANRKDVYVFYFDGTTYLAMGYNQNFASIG